MGNDFFRMTGIVKRYQMGDELQTVLRGVDLSVREGERTVGAEGRICGQFAKSAGCGGVDRAARARPSVGSAGRE